MISSGFFNSLEETEDRAYDADAFNEIFDGVVVDGVIQAAGDSLLVVESTSMHVIVGSGKAWFNMSWIKNDSDLNISVEASHPTLGRIDTVYMDFDKTDAIRENNIHILKGTPGTDPTPPTLVNEEDHRQIGLAHVTVDGGVTVITQADIENLVGTDDCPLMTGVLEQLDGALLLRQWDAIFWEWFNGLADNLDENTATNLLNMINQIREKPVPGRNVLVNGGMSVVQDTYPLSTAMTSFNGYPPQAPSLWKLNIEGTAGSWMVSQSTEEDPPERRWLDLTCMSAASSISSDAAVYIEQRLEGSVLAEFCKGTPQAKEYALSFMVYTNVESTLTVELVDVENDKHIIHEYTIGATDVDSPKRVEFTFSSDELDLILEDVSHQMTLRFWVVAGNDYKSSSPALSWTSYQQGQSTNNQTNMAGSAGNYIWFTDVQLEVGAYSTEFERLRDDEVLQKCERYYERRSAEFLVSAQSADSFISTTMQFFVEKRTDPTMSYEDCAVFPGPFDFSPVNVAKQSLSNTTREWAIFGDGGDSGVGGGHPVSLTPYASYKGSVEYIASSRL